MKTIKPKRLALLTRIYEHQNKSFLAINASVFFDFNQPRALLTEVEMWKFVAKALGKNVVLDMGMPKQHGEFLVFGQCHALQGTPINAATVSVQVGAQKKSLHVFGDRQWQSRFGVTTMTAPAPFTSIDLTYANAFGGAVYPANPLGKGMLVPGQIHRLPNIETPGALMLSPDDKPAPAGFGPISLSWPQRMSKAGTYDERWLKTRFPGYADDMDWSIFNSAPEDQWLAGFFSGNEKIQVTGMHPQQQIQHASLPECRVACFITQRTKEGEQFREIEMRPETLMLFPSNERGILLFRGVTEISTDDASDVIHLVAGVERLGVPKHMRHYQEILAIRLDKKKGAMHALDDAPLLPHQISDVSGQDLLNGQAQPVEKNLAQRVNIAGFPLTPAGTAVDSLTFPKLPSAAVSKLPDAADEIMAQAEKTLHEQHTKLLELAKQHTLPASVIEGINLAFSKEVSLDQLNPDNIDVQAEMQKQQLAAEQRLREICVQHKMDYDLLLKSATVAPVEPPKPMANTIMQQLTSVQDKLKTMGKPNADLDRLIADGPAELAALDAKMLQLFQQNQQHAQAPTSQVTVLLEEKAEEPVRKKSPNFVRGGNYAGLDLTGIDLSGLDLREADFSKAILEKANLSRAQLDGAMFIQAALTHVNLDGTNLSKANFTCAKLDYARFGNAIAHQANLSKATLSHADFGTADFSHANLTQCHLLNVKLGEANLTGVLAQQAKFMQSEPSSDGSKPQSSFPMHGIRFTGADLTKAVFLNCKMDQADFSGACLEKASFICAIGAEVNFSKARLNKICMVKGTVLTKANFTDAELKTANLRGTNLTGAQFANACLQGADLSGANLRGTDFKRAVATSARFAKADLGCANLSGANLHKAVMRNARLIGTNFLSANLYQADMLHSHVDATTVFDQANLKKTLLKDE